MNLFKKVWFHRFLVILPRVFGFLTSSLPLIWLSDRKFMQNFCRKFKESEPLIARQFSHFLLTKMNFGFWFYFLERTLRTCLFFSLTETYLTAYCKKVFCFRNNHFLECDGFIVMYLRPTIIVHTTFNIIRKEIAKKPLLKSMKKYLLRCHLWYFGYSFDKK